MARGEALNTTNDIDEFLRDCRPGDIVLFDSVDWSANLQKFAYPKPADHVALVVQTWKDEHRPYVVIAHSARPETWTALRKIGGADPIGNLLTKKAARCAGLSGEGRGGVGLASLRSYMSLKLASSSCQAILKHRRVEILRPPEEKIDRVIERAHQYVEHATSFGYRSGTIAAVYAFSKADYSQVRKKKPNGEVLKGPFWPLAKACWMISKINLTAKRIASRTGLHDLLDCVFGRQDQMICSEFVYRCFAESGAAIALGKGLFFDPEKDFPDSLAKTSQKQLTKRSAQLKPAETSTGESKTSLVQHLESESNSDDFTICQDWVQYILPGHFCGCTAKVEAIFVRSSGQ